MATTLQGRRLTEANKLTQIQLGAAAIDLGRRLLRQTVDPYRIDATLEMFLGLALVGAEQLHHTSTSTAVEYLRNYRAAEAGAAAAATMPVRTGVYDAAGSLDALTLISPMAKTFTGQGMAAPAALNQAYHLLAPRGLQAPVLAGGRDAIEASTAANDKSTGWRRVSDGNPCAWCAMLVTRGPVYNSPASAGDGRKYHVLCGCTAEEVFGEWVPTFEEQRYIDAYGRAHESGDTAAQTAAKMRAFGRFSDGERGKPLPAPWVEGASLADKLAIATRYRLTKEMVAKSRHLIPIDDSHLLQSEIPLTKAQLAELTDDVRAIVGQVDLSSTNRIMRFLIEDSDPYLAQNPRVQAYVYRGDTAIRINPILLKAPGRQVEPVGRNWWMPVATTTHRRRAVLAHEYGHVVDNVFRDTTTKRLTVRSSAHRWWLDNAKPDLSRYGATNPIEGYAEAFSEWLLGDGRSVIAKRYAKKYGWDKLRRRS